MTLYDASGLSASLDAFISRPRGYKTFFMLNSAELDFFSKFSMLINLKLLTMPISFLLNIAEH